VLPTLLAVDEAVADEESRRPPLPVIGQFIWEKRRLDLSLLSGVVNDGSQYLDLHCYIDHKRLVREFLEEEVALRTAIVVAGFRPDIWDWVEGQVALRDRTINAFAEESTAENLAQAIRGILRHRLATKGTIAVRDRTLRYNSARQFPLEQSKIPSYFKVPRTSVRDILSAFEGRNGVRLWCSVRRSGKTTACFDLSSTSVNTAIVSQTCEYTGVDADGSGIARYFYDNVRQALEGRGWIAEGFFRGLVRECAPGTADFQRYVFVLDEYETLFRVLANAASAEPLSRDRVAQPLLNQMVEFARENLIILVGQQPDAHFIFMDQNQLSPVVRQDRFPLFEHERDAEASELLLLLQKVFRGNIGFDAGFAWAVFEETGGHPYLTIAALVHLLDWAIGGRRVVAGPRLTASDFEAFTQGALGTSAVAGSSEYKVLINAARAALSPKGLRDSPWLHTIYTVLRGMVRQGGANFSMDPIEFGKLLKSAPGFAVLGMRREEFFRTAVDANFLQFRNGGVIPRVRLLARLADTIP
jgi:hypothetical protein